MFFYSMKRPIWRAYIMLYSLKAYSFLPSLAIAFYRHDRYALVFPKRSQAHRPRCTPCHAPRNPLDHSATWYTQVWDPYLTSENIQTNFFYSKSGSGGSGVGDKISALLSQFANSLVFQRIISISDATGRRSPQSSFRNQCEEIPKRCCHWVPPVAIETMVFVTSRL